MPFDPTSESTTEALDKMSARQRVDFLAVVNEMEQRKLEALNLLRPLKHAMPFLLCQASERLIRGGNQSSKSFTAAAEFVSAFTTLRLHDDEGHIIPFKFRRVENQLLWVFGWGEQHLGGTIYPMLFRPGAFLLIKDEKGEIRAWKPWLEWDRKHEEDTIPAPPLIPSRLIDPRGWSFRNKASRVLEVCRLRNGAEARFFTSGGECPQGAKPNIIWVDEDVKIHDHIHEMRIRQGAVRGRFWWSAFPHCANEALMEMSRRAKDQSEWPKPDVVEFRLRYRDNPYIPEEERRRILSAYNPRQIAARDEGEFIFDYLRVFPTFRTDVHGLPNGSMRDRLHMALEANNWKIPFDWSRYLVLDPGHAHPAVLFCAVPPKDIGDYVVAYDELYMRGMTGAEIARDVKAKAMGQPFEAFLIDGHAGRQTIGAVGKTQAQLYADAFEAAGLRSRKTAQYFILGSGDIKARNMIIRDWLTIRGDGTSKFRCIIEGTVALAKEFHLYRKRVGQDDVSEETIETKDNHLMACLGYLAAYGPTWVPPDSTFDKSDPILALYHELEKASQSPDSDRLWLGAGRAPPVI